MVEAWGGGSWQWQPACHLSSGPWPHVPCSLSLILQELLNKKDMVGGLGFLNLIPVVASA